MANQKSKGNTYENKVAKELGIWMFEDKHMLSRHLTSGAQKSAYVGDIVPQKRLPDYFNNGNWPFVVECKYGYKTIIPNLNNQNIIRTWLNKVVIERNDANNSQKVIYLIVSFHGYAPLLFTDIKLNDDVIISDLILNLKSNGKIIPFYIYKYKDLLELDFSLIYQNNLEMIDRLK